MGKKFNLTIIGISCFIFFMSVISSIFRIVSQLIEGRVGYGYIKIGYLYINSGFSFLDLFPLILGVYLFVKSIKDKKFYKNYKITINIFVWGMILLLPITLVVSIIMVFIATIELTFITVLRILLYCPVIVSLASLISLIIQMNKRKKKK